MVYSRKIKINGEKLFVSYEYEPGEPETGYNGSMDILFAMSDKKEDVIETGKYTDETIETAIKKDIEGDWE